jgi:hypothetical protein
MQRSTKDDMYDEYVTAQLAYISRGDIFRIENPIVWLIPMFSQIFPMRNMGRLCAKRL